MYKLRRAMLTAVDDAAMERITKKLVELAEGGDLEAIKILFGFTIGRPPQAIELAPSYPRDPLVGGSEEEQAARIERVGARIAEFDKRCMESLKSLIDMAPPLSVKVAPRAQEVQRHENPETLADSSGPVR
jgi:hypothetical protein